MRAAAANPDIGSHPARARVSRPASRGASLAQPALWGAAGRGSQHHDHMLSISIVDRKAGHSCYAAAESKSWQMNMASASLPCTHAHPSHIMSPSLVPGAIMPATLMPGADMPVVLKRRHARGPQVHSPHAWLSPNTAVPRALMPEPHAYSSHARGCLSCQGLSLMPTALMPGVLMPTAVMPGVVPMRTAISHE